ncbi:MAG: TolC family protein, partial [Algiphilus sp.]
MKRPICLATAFALTLFAGSAGAEAEASVAPLRIETVLAASAQHYPKIIEAVAATRSARAEALRAEGAFDLIFKT